MANYDIEVLYLGSNSLYARLDQRVASDGDLVWSGQSWNIQASPPVLETYDTSNWADYPLALSSLGGAVYVASKPAAVSGSYQYVVYEQQGDAPAASDIPIAMGFGGPGASGGSTAGVGADQVTVTITDGENPVANANVWISSDAGGSEVVAGARSTGTDGTVMFLLNAGVAYYLWMEKDGVNPILGQSFVAVAD